MMTFPEIIKQFSAAILSLVIAILLMVTNPETSFGQEEGLKDPVRLSVNPAQKLNDRVLSYFYPVTGSVLTVNEGMVSVNIMTENELLPGMRYPLFRTGKPFYHPVTREPIGRSESFAGRIEIVKMLEKEDLSQDTGMLYQCRIVSGSPEVGDIVRLTSSAVNLAFFQDKTAEWTLSESFYNALKDSGRFNLLESYSQTYDPEELSRLSKDLGAEVMLLFSTPVREGTIMLNVKLFWSESATLFSELEEPIPPDVISELVQQERLASLGEIEGEPWGSYRIEYGELIAMGDVDGDKEQEIVVSDGNMIRIYKYNEEPRELGHFEDEPNRNHLHVDVMDVNGNGRAEIFITSLVNLTLSADIADSEMQRKKARARVVSSVFEYDRSDGYRKIQDNIPYAMRIINSTLLMQKFVQNKTFTGPVLQGRLSDGHYLPDKAIQLPEGVSIYGFTYVDWENKGEKHILSFDDSGRLALFSGNEMIWKSPELVGAFEKSFSKQDSSAVKTEERWVVRGRLTTVKTQQGQEVIAVQKVPLVSQVPGLGYRRAVVYSLWWDGEAMVWKQVLGGIRGTVTDYLVHGNDLFLLTRPSLAVVLKNSLSGDFRRGSVLYYYALERK